MAVMHVRKLLYLLSYLHIVNFIYSNAGKFASINSQKYLTPCKSHCVLHISTVW